MDFPVSSQVQLIFKKYFNAIISKRGNVEMLLQSKFYSIASNELSLKDKFRQTSAVSFMEVIAME